MEYLQYLIILMWLKLIIVLVLNLIINGIPSIQFGNEFTKSYWLSFKPYYKWNTFNTPNTVDMKKIAVYVLNLIINGIPSIHNKRN